MGDYYVHSYCRRKERSEQNNIEDHLNDINTDAQFDALDYSIAHPYSC